MFVHQRILTLMPLGHVLGLHLYRQGNFVQILYGACLCLDRKGSEISLEREASGVGLNKEACLCMDREGSKICMERNTLGVGLDREACMCLDKKGSKISLDMEASRVGLDRACYQCQEGPRCQCFLETCLRCHSVPLRIHCQALLLDLEV